MLAADAKEGMQGRGLIRKSLSRVRPEAFLGRLLLSCKERIWCHPGKVISIYL